MRGKLNQKCRGQLVDFLLRRFEDSGRTSPAIVHHNGVRPNRQGARIQKNTIKEFLNQAGVRHLSINTGLGLFAFLAALFRVLQLIAMMLANTFAALLGIEIRRTATTQS